MNKTITREGLEALLKCLDQSPEAAAKKLLQLRQKLALIFERKMFPHGDALVDETLDRLATKIMTEEITSIPAYAHRIAMNICMEAARNERKFTPLSDAAGDGELPASEPDPEQQVIDASEVRRKQECLRKCLSRLASGERDLILEYYVGEKQERISQRRRLAERLGLTIEALRIETNDIRNRLRKWFEICIGMRSRVEYAGEENTRRRM
jgi:DNA-directed RNA polymerase specialized sigma24 family protein